MHANKTTTLAIIAIVTAIALVASGSITAPAVAVRRHASSNGDNVAIPGGSGLSSQVIKQLISCLTSLNGGVTKAAIDDCVNNALGMKFGSSPSDVLGSRSQSSSSPSDAFSSSSQSSQSAPSTSMMTGQ